jgi:hypothetical protein
LEYLVNRYDGRRRIEQDFKAMIENHPGDLVFGRAIKDSAARGNAPNPTRCDPPGRL